MALVKPELPAGMFVSTVASQRSNVQPSVAETCDCMPHSIGHRHSVGWSKIVLVRGPIGAVMHTVRLRQRVHALANLDWCLWNHSVVLLRLELPAQIARGAGLELL